jgi:Fe2+ transport system protein FeoA
VTSRPLTLLLVLAPLLTARGAASAQANAHAVRGIAVDSRLADAAPGERVRVRQVMDKDAARLRYLAELGIRPGAHVSVVDRTPFDGPITLLVGGAGAEVTRAVGPVLAAQVFVEPLRAE